MSDYGEVFDKYLSAYNRKAEILASPTAETDGHSSTADVAKAALIDSVLIKQVYQYDNTVNAVALYNTTEVNAQDATMAELLPELLDYFANVASGSAKAVIFLETNQAIIPDGSEAVDVVAYPFV